jgi:hypothetical protein
MITDVFSDRITPKWDEENTNTGVDQISVIDIVDIGVLLSCCDNVLLEWYILCRDDPMRL